MRGVLAWAAGPGGTVLSLAFVLAVGMATTAIPLTLGLRSFRSLEA